MNFRNTWIDGKDRQLEEEEEEEDLSRLCTSADLTRQPSILSLTFDEFQSTLGGSGKDFGSMNMEELLKSIWHAEEMTTGLPESGGSGLPRQGSLTLPRTVSIKTVDEVWRDLSPRKSTGVVNAQEAPVVDLQTQQSQSTLGEMTLEEFLDRAGITREQILLPESFVISGADNSVGSNPSDSTFYRNFTGTTSTVTVGVSLGFPSTNTNSINNSTQTSHLADIVSDATQSSSFTHPLQLGINEEAGYEHGVEGRREMGVGDQVMSNGLLSPGIQFGATEALTTWSPANPTSDRFGTRKIKINGGLSHLPPLPCVFEKFSKKGAIEKAVERRQKRMIKNRESAARSRARKQAYTTELEQEVTKLQQQNQALQKKKEVLEVEKNQALEIINQQCRSKKLSLRRTRTGPW